MRAEAEGYQLAMSGSSPTPYYTPPPPSLSRMRQHNFVMNPIETNRVQDNAI